MESGAGRRSVLTKNTTWAIWAETIKLDSDYTHFESDAAVKIWYYQLSIDEENNTCLSYI